jgi:hypothetical protein
MIIGQWKTELLPMGVSKSRICDADKWVEKRLIKDGCFAPPLKCGTGKERYGDLCRYN